MTDKEQINSNKLATEELDRRLKELEEKKTPLIKDKLFVDVPKEGQRMIQELEIGKLKNIVDKTEYGLLSSAQKTDLTDGGASTAHKHDHGNMDGLDGDDHPQYMKDVIDDTSPQLGGNLNAYNKSIKWLGGKGQVHIINKALTDDSASQIFEVSGAEAVGGACIISWSTSVLAEFASGLEIVNFAFTGPTNQRASQYTLGSGLSAVFSTSNATGKVTVSVACNSVANNNPDFTAHILILASGDVTFTAL